MCGDTAAVTPALSTARLQDRPGALPREPPAAHVEEHRSRAAARAHQAGTAPDEVRLECAAPPTTPPGPDAACRPCRAAGPPCGPGPGRRRRVPRPPRSGRRCRTAARAALGRAGPRGVWSKPAASRTRLTSSTVMAFGSRRGAAGGRTARAGVVDGEAFPGGEPVQAAHGDHRAGRRARGERRMLVVAPTQLGEEVGEVVLPHVGQVGQPACRAPADVAAQVTPVRRHGVRREAALDHQVVLVRGDDPRQRGRPRRSVQRPRLGCAPGARCHARRLPDITDGGPGATLPTRAASAAPRWDGRTPDGRRLRRAPQASTDSSVTCSSPKASATAA